MFWYAFREREQILDLFELVTGYRMHTRYFQVGGLAEDIPRGFYPEARKFCEWMPKAIDDYETLLTRNKIWLERTEGIGLLSAADAIALGQSGPVLRASGVDWDLRRAEPYLAYHQVDFRVPVYPEGDVYARYRVHMEEMRESVKIVAQCLDRLENMEGEPWIADDRKVVLPPRHELHTSMESLIHHFKIVTEGFRVPEGEVYFAIESPRGELGCYVCSDGGAEAVARQVPRAVVRRAAGDGDVHDGRADRRHDRDRRLARHGDGRGRPVTHAATTRSRRSGRSIRRTRARPSLPALRLAQERVRLAVARRAARGRRRARPDARVLQGGRVVLRPCSSSQPVGEHLVEVCTNVSCALVGAQQVLEAFEAELGCRAGETSDDGKVTLRTVECLGGCGWGTIVAVDHQLPHARRRQTTCRRSSRSSVASVEPIVLAESRRRVSPSTRPAAATRRSPRRAR